ncbi:hypothetical protein N0V84_011289 [Fusarium piperis]|uniref:Uncharacterized protein n=1 Tax=Fusarium piperis TaxID=1435070 RepID=A0A9W8TBH4_9HYPO|nr:hypothetical protein N0V84_011289 [Fusarium piperis]
MLPVITAAMAMALQYGSWIAGGAALYAATYLPDYFRPPHPAPKEFLIKVCPLQWDIYDENEQHITLYSFLDLNPATETYDIWTAYQQATERHNGAVRSCIDSLIDSNGERITEGIPPACLTDQYRTAEKKLHVITNAALVLLDQDSRSLYDQHFLYPMYEIEDLSDVVADKSKLKNWKKKMDKMMRLQSEIRKSMCKICKQYVRKGACD